MLMHAGYSPSLLVVPWEASNSSFFPLYVLVIVLAAWRLARIVADRAFDQHAPAIRAKCGNCMLGIIATILALAWYAKTGLFSLLCLPKQFDPPSAEQTLQFVSGIAAAASIAVCVYVIEIAIDVHMRAVLVLHHATTITVIMWGCAVI